MKAALTLGLLLAALAAVSAALPPRVQDAPAAEVAVLSFEWKYAGYDRAETVKSNESSLTDGPETLYRIARGTVYVFKYTAKATFKNTGTKAVKSVSWDYVFTDEKEGKELKRHKLQSKWQILPGETQTVSVVFGLDPKEKAPYIKTGKQSVEITKVEYADGSAWKK